MSITDKLTYLQTTKQLLKTEINKINNVLDDNSTFRSYPQELFNGYLDILNNGTDTLWNNLEKVSQTGTEPVLENVETAPIKMVLNGNTIQDGTPTPDTPVEVKVVTGENVVSVSGKNLFDVTKHTNTLDANTTIISANEYTCNVVTAWRGRVIVPINDFKKNTDYTFSYISNNPRSIISRINGVKDGVSTTLIQNYYYVYTNKATINTSDYDEIIIDLYATGNGSTLAETSISNLQFEEGTSITSFVPYSKTDYPINLGDIELCKIGNYKDYLFKRNGKWYVHKIIKKILLNGSENWTKSGISFQASRATSDIGYKDLSFSSIYKFNSTHTGASIAFNNYEFGYNTTGVLTIRDDRFTIVDDFKTWLSNNNVTLYYVLATPTEEEITNTTLIEQLEAIYRAKSVKDKTYITQTNDELPFILDVEAIKEYEVN